MSASKTGHAFVKHEFDELISIQRNLVAAEESLATTHPRSTTKRAIRAALADDRDLLETWERLGAPYGASGEVEDVAAGLTELMEQTLATAGSEGADSEFYEAHAVLVTLKRKQMDGASGVRRIATAIGDRDLRTAASSFERAQRLSGGVLGRELAAYAKEIAAMSGSDGRDANKPTTARASRRATGRSAGRGHGRTAGARRDGMAAAAR